MIVPRRQARLHRLAALLALAAGAGFASGTARASDVPSYNRDVRPILSENCFSCHGPDKNHQKADLRLDVREAALAAEAFVPGDAEKSELIYRITTDDDADLMPPEDSHKSLTGPQKETLRAWIDAGAEYEAHWAYVPPSRPTVPDRGHANPIDNFIAAELENHSLAPAPGAAPHTLARRLALDLTGLPPSPEQVETFQGDPRFAIETLLASPHFGERMAVPYLDIVRFADTVGFHGDQNQRIFPYRDYVIDAFNANKPYDQFVTEQLAGDLLPDPTPEQRVATGFNRLNMMTREGGAQPKEYLAKSQADRVRAVSTAFLGSTLACAECHDHKFDPFSAKDFYAMAAYFADLQQWGVYADYGYTPNPDLRGYNNDYPFPPEIEVENRSLAHRRDRLLAALEAVAETTAARHREPFERWKEEAAAFLEVHPSGWQELTLTDPQAPEFDGKKATATYAAPDVPASAIRVRLAGRTADSPRTTVTVRIRGARVLHADAADKVPDFSNGADRIGIEHRWITDAKAPADAIFLLAEPLGSVTIDFVADHPVTPEVSASPAPPLPTDQFYISGGTSPTLFALASGTVADAANPALPLYAQLLETRHGKAFTMVSDTRAEPLETRLLARGNWQDESGEILAPSPPEFLAGSPPAADAPRQTRLDLARWITSPENPLTARTFVNRLWHQFFGAGLSGVLDDLGNQGEWPTHPELLDWLAVEFVESGWDIKHIVRQIVTSETYARSSDATPGQVAADPKNRLLARQSPRRLPAEFVRDNALAVSGLLNADVGGPSARPFQPAGYYASLNFPAREYQPSTGRDQYRRGLYTHWQRTFLHPMLANFDAPSREECTAQRTVSNTPQQALTLLNDPTFAEAARHLATEVTARHTTADARLDAAFLRALARPPTEAERASLTEFLSTLTGPEPEAWFHLCRVLLNLHESITIY
ncbi:PSD1 and planctomycete cytochrome C domain-containing protein [soil metagenome]